MAYLAVLLGIGLWARRRTHDSADFHLAGRKLGPFVAALSASASSSSAWTLLGVSGAAWLWGLQAIWLIPAIVSGFAINWFAVAPRLQRTSRANGAVTLVEYLAEGSDPGTMRILRGFGALIILFCFTFYVASQLQAAGTAIGSAVDGIGDTHALILGAGVVVVYVTLTIPQVILVESFLSFLGLGVQEPLTSWGALVNEGAQELETAPWSLIFPASFLAVTLFAFNFLGDGLRDALDPRDR